MRLNSNTHGHVVSVAIEFYGLGMSRTRGVNIEVPRPRALADARTGTVPMQMMAVGRARGANWPDPTATIVGGSDLCRTATGERVGARARLVNTFFFDGVAASYVA